MNALNMKCSGWCEAEKSHSQFFVTAPTALTAVQGLFWYFYINVLSLYCCGRLEIEGMGSVWLRDQKVRLRHVDTNAYLHSHDKKYSRIVTGQQEVCGVTKKSADNIWSAAEGVYFPVKHKDWCLSLWRLPLVQFPTTSFQDITNFKNNHSHLAIDVEIAVISNLWRDHGFAMEFTA